MSERTLRKEVVVNATIETVWNAWTTEDGLRFASPNSRVDLRPGGDYAWFLDLDPDDQGRRGSEGSTIVSVSPPTELVFAWNFPPVVTPTLRSTGATTMVTVNLVEVDDGTRVTLTATGWEPGEEWDRGYEYFDQAWDVVLGRLKDSLS